MVPCLRCLTIPLVALSLVVVAPIGAFAQDAPVRVSERLRHKDRLAAVDLPANTVVVELTLASVPAAPVRVGVIKAVPARAGRESLAPRVPPVAPDPLPSETMDLVAVALGGGGGGGGDFQAMMESYQTYITEDNKLRKKYEDENGNLEEHIGNIEKMLTEDQLEKFNYTRPQRGGRRRGGGGGFQQQLIKPSFDARQTGFGR